MKLGFIKLPPNARQKHLVVFDLAEPARVRSRLVIATVASGAIWILSALSKIVLGFTWPWQISFSVGFGALVLLSLIVKIDRTAAAEKETQDTNKNEHAKTG